MSEVSLAHFWLSVETKFPHLSKKALQVLILFTSSYLCECGFSAFTSIKNKYWPSLQVEDDIRLFLSTVRPPQQVHIKEANSLLPLR